jgi:hypothetical protein
MKIVPWFAGFIGSYVGWYIGYKFGLFTAIMLSIVGMGVGGYYGRKWVLQNL